MFNEDDEVKVLVPYEDIDDEFDGYDDDDDKPVRRVRPRLVSMLFNKPKDVPVVGSAEAEAQKAKLRKDTERLMNEYKTKGGEIKRYNGKGELITP